MNITSGAQNPCLYYFVQVNSAGIPLLGTMMAHANSNKLPLDDRCSMARVPNTQMSIPAGRQRCIFPNHLRYYYKVNSRTGAILQNSMFEMVGKPKNMCSGVYTILEFIVTQPA